MMKSAVKARWIMQIILLALFVLIGVAAVLLIGKPDEGGYYSPAEFESSTEYGES